MKWKEMLHHEKIDLRTHHVFTILSVDLARILAGRLHSNTCEMLTCSDSSQRTRTDLQFSLEKLQRIDCPKNRSLINK